MKARILITLMWLAVACNNESKNNTDTPIADLDDEVPLILEEVEGSPDRKPTLGLKYSLRAGTVIHRISRSPLKLPIYAVDYEGREIRYFVQCSDLGGDRTEITELIAAYCKEALSVDDHGLITLRSPYSFKFTPDEIVSLSKKILSLKVTISNGIVKDRLDFRRTIRLVAVDLETVDLRDSQYLPSDLDSLPELKRLVLKQTAFHGRFPTFKDDPKLGGLGGGVSTSWYLGSDGKNHFMASAHHAMTIGPNKKISRHHVNFPYLGIKGRVDKWVYYDDSNDFAIYTLKIESNPHGATLREIPINYEYLPKSGDHLFSAGFSNIDVSYLYPGVDDNSTCRVLSEVPVESLADSFYSVTGFHTGCQTWTGDSGGPIALKSSNEVVGVVTNIAVANDDAWIVSIDLAESNFSKGQYYGSYLVPFSDIRKAMIENFDQLDKAYVSYLSKMFNL